MVKKPMISMEWNEWRLKTRKTGPLRILMATRLRRYRFARKPFNLNPAVGGFEVPVLRGCHCCRGCLAKT